MKFPLLLSEYIGLITLSSIEDSRLTVTMRNRNNVGSGQNWAIPNPVIILANTNIEKIVQFTIDGRPVQFLAKKKRTIAFVCAITESFREWLEISTLGA